MTAGKISLNRSNKKETQELSKNNNGLEVLAYFQCSEDTQDRTFETSYLLSISSPSFFAKI